jgi:hypothetical protein
VLLFNLFVNSLIIISLLTNYLDYQSILTFSFIYTKIKLILLIDDLIVALFYFLTFNFNFYVDSIIYLIFNFHSLIGYFVLKQFILYLIILIIFCILFLIMHFIIIKLLNQLLIIILYERYVNQVINLSFNDEGLNGLVFFISY